MYNDLKEKTHSRQSAIEEGKAQVLGTILKR